MPARRPSFVVFYCDDLGYGDLGCQGSETIRTPHIDSLAAGGIRFRSWYSNSPVCSPSRASLLTGRYPQRTGVAEILPGKRGTPGLAPGVPTIADVLRDGGYATACVGKWHLGTSPEAGPNAHGFDEFFGFRAGCFDYYSHIFYWGAFAGENPVHDLWDDEREVWQNGRYFTELITERATRFIDRCADYDHPFFLYVPYNAPHYPMHAPEEYIDRYPDLPWDRQIMAAMVSAVDDSVGEIAGALRRHGIDGDTLVFFSSDNGPSSESRNWLDGREDRYYGGSAGIFRGHKASLFDGGIREPAIVSWPGHVPAGRVSDEVCATFDVMPTLLEAAGADIPAGMDGTSILGLLAGDVPGPHESLCWEYHGQLAVRRDRWKLVLNGRLDFQRTQPDAVFLSDVVADPGERQNLAARYPEVASELETTVRAWYAGVTGENR